MAKSKFEEILEGLHPPAEEGFIVGDVTPTTRQTHNLVKTESDLKTRLLESAKSMREKFSGNVIHELSVHVPTDGVEGGHEITYQRKFTPLREGEFYIGVGDYMTLSKLMSEQRTSRGDAIWRFMYDRLGLRVPGDVILKSATKRRRSLDAVERIGEDLFSAHRYLLEKSGFFGTKGEPAKLPDGTPLKQAYDQILLQHFFPKDNRQHVDDIINKTTVFMSADWETEVIVGKFWKKSKTKIVKRVYMLTAREQDSKSFMANDYALLATGNSLKNEWAAVSVAMAAFLRETPKNYTLLLVPTEAEAKFHRDFLTNEVYAGHKKKVHIVPITDQGYAELRR